MTPWRRSTTPASELVGAEDRAVDADEEVVPDAVGDGVLDEPDAAVAEADVHAAGVQAAGLAADVVGLAAVAGHPELAAVGELRGEGPAGLDLVAAVVA